MQVAYSDNTDALDDSEAVQQRKAEIAAQRAALEQMVAARIRDAIDARVQSGIEMVWLADQDQYDGIDDYVVTDNAPPATRRKTEGQADAGNSQRSKVFLNITAPKTDIAVSRVQELLLPHDDRPWEITATPVPEFDKAADGMMDRELQLADGTMAKAKDVAAVMKAKAAEKADAASDQIEDWLVEASAYSEMRAVVRDAGRLGTGILKGPVPVERKVRRWDLQGNVARLQIQTKVAPTSVRKEVWDFWPDPSCGEDVHNGAFCVDREYATTRMLKACQNLPGYDKQKLAEVLRQGPMRRSRYDDRDTREALGQVNTMQTETFEVFNYYGDIDPATLQAGGFIVPQMNDGETPEKLAQQVADMLQLATVPVVVTVINECIVRMTLNPDETGAFPFDVFPWRPMAGQIWGRGVPHSMSVAQRGLNAAVRAMLENAGMSAGPQIVIDRHAIEPANQRWEITGRKLWYWTASEEVKDVKDAFSSFTIPSAQAELQSIIEFFLKMADEMSNLPMLLQGIVGQQSPDTLGGQAMAVANATSPLRAIAKTFDDKLIGPHLRRYYDWLMQDPEVSADAKGDLMCRARGSSALIYRDVATQILPQLLPVVKDPSFGLNPNKWLDMVLRGAHITPEAIKFTKEERQAIQEQQHEQGAPADPRIEAAQINAKAKADDRQADIQMRQQELQQDAAEGAAERESRAQLADIQFQIQSLEFAGQKEISFEQLRAMLATKSMDIRQKREAQATELEFASTKGEGRGI
jgi:hypothetical protein